MSDRIIAAADNMLRTLFSRPSSARPLPSRSVTSTLTDMETRHAAGLMRVNHVGEVCAQALYTGQMLATRDPALIDKLSHARQEETDHLSWCRTRLDQLDSRTSYLNAAWYLGALAMGYIAGKAGDQRSLGFLKETEHQVVSHLQHHLESLPANDAESRAIVHQMLQDEAAHAQMAQDNGATQLGKVPATAMKGISRVMTTVAYRL